MKLVLYSSSLEVGGGGEKYFLSVVDAAVKAGLVPRIMSPKPADHDAWQRLDIDLDPNVYTWHRADDRSIARHTVGADLFVCMSNSHPVTFAKRSVALIQFPGRDLRPRRYSHAQLLAELKKATHRQILRRYELVCYSEYVRVHTAQRFCRKDVTVVFPPFTPVTNVGAKTRSIVSVARFFPMKRQDGLIDAFRRLRTEVPAAQDWELHLVGIAHRSSAGAAYLDRLRAMAEGLPVTFHIDASRDEVAHLYGEASIFWHAAGLGMQDDPSQQEHFGIVTVEAMNHGCVPVVIGTGGQPEIVEDETSGLLWQTPEQLVAQTRRVIEDPGLRARLGGAARAASYRFSADVFRDAATRTILGVS